MNRAIMPVLLALLSGCASSAKSPATEWGQGNGVVEWRANNGKLLSRQVWKDKRLVSAWEYQVPEFLPEEIIDAVNRGERNWPEPEWIQAVTHGEGFLHDFDKEGNVIGWFHFWNGQWDRAGH